MERHYPCNCGSCDNLLSLNYFGENLNLISAKRKDLDENDLATLNNFYFKFRTYMKKERKEDGSLETSVRVDVSEIPKMVEYLQKIYDTHQEVLNNQIEQGRLETLSENNKANLSSQYGVFVKKPWPKDPIKNFELCSAKVLKQKNLSRKPDF